jgi:hypothetical protein
MLALAAPPTACAAVHQVGLEFMATRVALVSLLAAEVTATDIVHLPDSTQGTALVVVGLDRLLAQAGTRLKARS